MNCNKILLLINYLLVNTVQKVWWCTSWEYRPAPFGLVAWYVFSLDIMLAQGENKCSSSYALVPDLLPRPKALTAVGLLLLARPGSSSLYLFLIVWPKAAVGHSVHVNFLCWLGLHRYCLWNFKNGITVHFSCMSSENYSVYFLLESIYRCAR